VDDMRPQVTGARAIATEENARGILMPVCIQCLRLSARGLADNIMTRLRKQFEIIYGMDMHLFDVD